MFCGIVPQGMERIMDEPVVLRTAKVGGFVKEDVLQYVDELNSKNFGFFVTASISNRKSLSIT